MEDKKYTVIDIAGLNTQQLEEKLNHFHAKGYKRVCQSNLQWYQGQGDWGVIVFERLEQTEIN